MRMRLATSLLALCALALAGCSESFEDISPKAEREIPSELVQSMKAKGMSRTSPIMIRTFKEEGVMEIWKQKDTGRFDLVTSYNICKWSGKLGPKFVEGDRQAPEGFYSITPAQMNPKSKFHLAFNIGYPNAYDRAHGRGGSNLMVHGACSSSGCYSMTNEQVEEIWAFARDAFRGGQAAFQFQAYPFRMTPANMARYRDDPNYAFWKMLKEGYDHFEITKVPPKVDICEKRYVFNRIPEGEATFSATGACPASTQPETLVTAFQSYQSSFDAAFSTEAAKGAALPRRASIAGLKEAAIVAEWSKRRSRGERVPLEPPSLASDGRVVQTTAAMGRVDSPAGRRQAAIDAEVAAKKKAEEEKKAAALRAEQERAAARAAEEAAKVAAENPQPAVAPAPEKPGLLGGVGKRIGNLFGS